MKGKQLVLINGLIGLIGGIFLLLGVFFIASSITNDTLDTLSNFADGRSSISTSSTTFISILLFLVKLAILGFGIVGAINLKGDTRIGSAPHILLIVGGAVAIIPFLGWAGGIVAIVGGSLYLAKLKNFN